MPALKAVETTQLPGIGDGDAIYGYTNIMKDCPVGDSMSYVGTVVMELVRTSCTENSSGI